MFAPAQHYSESKFSSYRINVLDLLKFEAQSSSSPSLACEDSQVPWEQLKEITGYRRCACAWVQKEISTSKAHNLDPFAVSIAKENK